MEENFRVTFLMEATNFMDSLDDKTREKVLYNIWKARFSKDKNLFKKLDREIWEFRTRYKKKFIRLFAFWDKSDKVDTVVVATHGIVKKTGKVPAGAIQKAESIRQQYFNEK